MDNILTRLFEIVTPEMWVVAAAVYGICFALKKAAFFPDRFIPLSAVALGVLLNVAAAAMFSREIIISAVTNGVICGMAAVYLANIIKQAKGGGTDETQGIE